MLSSWADSPIITLQGKLDSNEAKHLALVLAPAQKSMREPPIATITRLEESSSDVRLLLRGEFDITNRRQLLTPLESSLASPMITIDLAQATHVDASILGLLARFARLRRELHAAPLQLSGASAHCRTLLSLCKLETVFSIEEEFKRTPA